MRRVGRTSRCKWRRRLLVNRMMSKLSGGLEGLGMRVRRVRREGKTVIRRWCGRVQTGTFLSGRVRITALHPYIREDPTPLRPCGDKATWAILLHGWRGERWGMLGVGDCSENQTDAQAKNGTGTRAQVLVTVL